MIESPTENVATAPGNYRTDFGAPRLRRHSSFGSSGKSRYRLVSRRRLPNYGSGERTSTPRRSVQHAPPRSILVAAPVDMSKRRMGDRRRPPANKAAQLRTIPLRLAGQVAHAARHPCVAKTT
jgi:hypothetical protein